MTKDEIDKFFFFDQTNSRMVGAATNPAIARDNSAIAVSIYAQLLDRANKQPSDRWLWLQLQPADAMALAASILALAIREQWPIRPDFLDAVEQIQLSGKTQKH